MDKLSPETAAPRDWFVPAIECNGTVADCLGAVMTELGQRTSFIQALSACLEVPGDSFQAKSMDAVTDLGQKIKGLENTLKFRLGILRPERPQAWFRAPAATSAGPFSSTLIDEPVFASFDFHETERVKRSLAALWTERKARPLPFKDEGGSLWRTLLSFNAEYKRVTELPAPFAGLSLADLPDGLPPNLDSRALRAFLINVRNEVRAARERLDACHRQLKDASERFFRFQEEHERGERPGFSQAAGDGRARFNPQADSMREEFRRRRDRQPGGSGKIIMAPDADALKFMGFDEFPTVDSLRQRYLVLAKRYHPDLNGGDGGAFKRLSGAYSHLMNRLETVK